MTGRNNKQPSVAMNWKKKPVTRRLDTDRPKSVFSRTRKITKKIESSVRSVNDRGDLIPIFPNRLSLVGDIILYENRTVRSIDERSARTLVSDRFESVIVRGSVKRAAQLENDCPESQAAKCLNIKSIVPSSCRRRRCTTAAVFTV